MKWIAIASAFAISNYLYQVLTERQWKVAAERTFFQTVATFIIWLTIGRTA